MKLNFFVKIIKFQVTSINDTNVCSVNEPITKNISLFDLEIKHVIVEVILINKNFIGTLFDF